MSDPRYERSTHWLAYARAVTPGGAQTRSRAATSYVEGAYPSCLDAAQGCRVRDLDGHWYVDWIGGLGSIGIGHADPRVNAAAIAQLNRTGGSPSLPTRLEAELAEGLIAAIPCAEMVRFVKTGSEATEAAMRIARVATGRAVIVSCGYHGWHSVHDAAKAEHPGVPAAFCDGIVDVQYNDLDQLQLGLQGHHASSPEGDVAAVLLEPVLHDQPAAGYLAGVIRMAHEAGALVIFDEVVTGFRWAIGGAQEFFGVTPDLACFGKAMGNGFPLAAVVGRRDLMEAGARFVSSTHGGEPVSLAAGIEVLRQYREEGVVARIWAAGEALQGGVNALGGPIRIGGYPCKPRLEIGPAIGDQDARDLLLSLFVQEAAARGVLLQPLSLAPGAAHDEAAVRVTVEACAAAMEVCSAAVTAGDVAEHMRGVPFQRAFKRDLGPASVTA